MLDEIWTSISESAPQLLLALLLLVVGWVLARILSKGVFVLLARTSIDDWAARRLGVKTGGKYGHRVERIVARLVFYALLLLVLILVLNTLDTGPVSQPLINLVDTIVAALPKVLLAGIIVLIAFVVGKILGFSLTKALQAARVDDRLSRYVGFEKHEDRLAQTVGDLTFWFIMVVGIIQALDALDMTSLVEPLRGALGDLAGVLPNLLAAGIVLVVGMLLARFAGRLVASLLRELGFDGWVARIGLIKEIPVPGTASVVAAEADLEGGPGVAAPPVAPAASAGAEEAPSGAEAAAAGAVLPAAPASGETTGDAWSGIPAPVRPAGASGGAPATTPAAATSIPEDAEASARLAALNLRARRTPSDVVGMIVRVVIALLVLSQALSILELNRVARLVDALIDFLPDLGIAAVILLAGLWAGNAVKRRVDELYPGPDEGLQRFLGATARVGILIFAAAIALQQIGVAPDLIVTAFAILFGAVCLAMALAFGLGGRDVAGEIVRQGYDEYAPKTPRARRTKK